jgi:LPS-assembly lipoprotein
MKTSARLAVTSLLLLAFGVTSGCGFQLQGRSVMPAALATVHLDEKDGQSEFTHALRSQLTIAGSRLVAEGAPDSATVRILEDTVTERVLSVSSRNIPTDYELTYEVRVSVSAAGRELLAAEEFSLSRIYSFDERKLLAKEREKEILMEALARDMASVVARRLASL